MIPFLFCNCFLKLIMRKVNYTEAKTIKRNTRTSVLHTCKLLMHLCIEKHGFRLIYVSAHVINKVIYQRGSTASCNGSIPPDWRKFFGYGA